MTDPHPDAAPVEGLLEVDSGAPAAPPAPAEATAKPAPPRRDGATGLAGSRILVLDDDPTMRNVILATLKQAGCAEVLASGNGAEALRRVALRPVDLILCDWQMPMMDGLTFLKQLRASPAGAEVPVVMLTANQEPADACAAQRHDIAGWLLKPIAPQSVAAQVASVLGRRTPRVREDVLHRLLARYEEALPEETAKLHAYVAAWDAAAPGFDDRMEEVLRRMHLAKGQAGTMGYALLGQLAAIVHDALRVAAELPPPALAPHRAELTRLSRVATSGMKLVADRRLRGEGGAAGAKMREQLGAFADALRAKLAEAAAQRPAAAGRGPAARRTAGEGAAGPGGGG